MRMIPDLDCNDFARLEICQTSADSLVSRLVFDLSETKEYPTLRMENGRLVPVPLQRLAPGDAQGIRAFPHLRNGPSAATVPTLFPP